MTVTKRHDSLVLPMIYQIDNLVTRRDLDLVGTNPKLAKVSFCLAPVDSWRFSAPPLVC